jgi:hypothetical protein
MHHVPRGPQQKERSAKTVGFVGVVPVVLNQHTDLGALVRHYRDEAFAGISTPIRGGLVIGLNMQVGGDRAWSEEHYNRAIAGLDHGKADFPVTVVPFSWYWDGRTDEKGKLSIPYGMIREFVVNHAETKQIAQTLRSSGLKDVYVHLGDADVHSLHVGPFDRGANPAPRSGLFGAAADALHAETYPDVLSGGYRAPDHASLMEKLAVEADMQVRLALARRSVRVDGGNGNGGRRTVKEPLGPDPREIAPTGTRFDFAMTDKQKSDERNSLAQTGVQRNPSALGYGPYLPEPNTFVKHDPQRDLVFGTGANETVNMIKELGAPRIVFDSRLAIATDMERLGKEFHKDTTLRSIKNNLEELKKVYEGEIVGKGKKKEWVEGIRRTVDDVAAEGYDSAQARDLVGDLDLEDHLLSEAVVQLFNDPRAEVPIGKLRNALRLVLQSHMAPGQPRPPEFYGNFELSLERVKERGGDNESAEAEAAAMVATEADLTHALSVVLRTALAAWRAGQGFDPLAES